MRFPFLPIFKPTPTQTPLLSIPNYSYVLETIFAGTNEVPEVFLVTYLPQIEHRNQFFRPHICHFTRARRPDEHDTQCAHLTQLQR